jgi:glyoxylase-like metal-dependent hydrolase (beta-lactamase superfamily II)
VKLGNITVQPIVEMVSPFMLPGDVMAEATPEVMEGHRAWLEPWSLCPKTGKLIIVVQSWLVRTAHHTILIDTCVGCDKEAQFYPDWHNRSDHIWLERLAAAGVQPEQVDYIFCTHLHLDHVGWNTRLLDGRHVPTFPNAKYIFAKADVDEAEAGDEASFRQSVLPVMEAGQAQLVAGDFALDDNVWLEPTPGHTSGHVAVGLVSEGARAVMCGDLIHFPVQCAHPDWVVGFDTDPVQGCATRQSFLADNCESGRLVLTAHFPGTSMGYVERAGDAFGFRFHNG